MRARVAASTSWGRSNKRNRVTYHQSRAEGETRGHTGEQRGKAIVGPKRAHPSEGSQIVLCFFFQMNLLLQPGRTDRQNRPLVVIKLALEMTGPRLFREWAQDKERRAGCWVETGGPAHPGREQEVAQFLPHSHTLEVYVPTRL